LVNAAGLDDQETIRQLLSVAADLDIHAKEKNSQIQKLVLEKIKQA